MFTFASCTQEQLHSAVREASRKVIAVRTVIHQADGQARQEMVQNAWQEQRCSVLNKPDGLNHLSDRRTTLFVQDSFVKTIKKHFKRQIRLTLLSVCSFEKVISACLGRIHLVIFHDVHQALKFLPPNKFPRQSSKDTHTHTQNSHSQRAMKFKMEPLLLGHSTTRRPAEQLLQWNRAHTFPLSVYAWKSAAN